MLLLQNIFIPCVIFHPLDIYFFKKYKDYKGCMCMHVYLYSLYSKNFWIWFYSALFWKNPLTFLPYFFLCNKKKSSGAQVSKALNNWVWQELLFFQCNWSFLCLVILAASVLTLWFPMIAVIGYILSNLLCFKWHLILKRSQQQRTVNASENKILFIPTMT